MFVDAYDYALLVTNNSECSSAFQTSGTRLVVKITDARIHPHVEYGMYGVFFKYMSTM